MKEIPHKAPNFTYSKTQIKHQIKRKIKISIEK
jgi:hypothetical protein